MLLAILTETVKQSVFIIILQSENLIVISLVAINWVEVIAGVVRIAILLDSVGYWRAMLTVEYYVSRYFFVLQLVSLVFSYC